MLLLSFGVGSSFGFFGFGSVLRCPRFRFGFVLGFFLSVACASCYVLWLFFRAHCGPQCIVSDALLSWSGKCYISWFGGYVLSSLLVWSTCYIA